ncbi:MAG: DUF2959 domain-containing protein [Porticoccaceae bacterium]|jgi:hypothetical protein|nr:DUF2959 domain-containing protein [Porticoccaceae bacterium]MEA3301135.1 DUF2959 domain-containing protein [Pseudomonadota bacterium]HLS98495.1 DUF2959 domain-containing protein [Porticoccaceae bacterium]
MRHPFSVFALLCALLLTACESAYYGTLEKVGVHKREILVDRIEAVKDAQVDGQEQFKSALAQFQQTVNFDGGKLEVAYQRLDSEYQASEQAAATIRERIAAVESVAEALFDEWEDELALYTSPGLRQQSQTQLADTRRRYRSLLATMKTAEKSLAPVLNTLRDNSLYLKHNLNARAIASLKREAATIQADVDRLIRDMDAAIAASDRFIAEFARQGQ